MAFNSRMTKIRQYPRPHKDNIHYFQSMEIANQDSTIIQMIRHDEGLGAPDTYNSNPSHASFALATMPNCFVESRINNIFAEIRFSLTKGAIETDKVVSLRMAFMPIFVSFLEDLDATDEVSGADIESILELTHETTDRQTHPLFNGTDLTAKYSGSSDVDAASDTGLTTDDKIEGVAFSTNTYWNILQYGTNGGKLRSTSGGLKWFILDANHPTRKFRIRIRPKVKRMNPYAFMGLLTHLPQVDTAEQIPVAGDTTAISHVAVDFAMRYNEWNEHFDHARV